MYDKWQTNNELINKIVDSAKSEDILELSNYFCDQFCVWLIKQHEIQWINTHLLSIANEHAEPGTDFAIGTQE